MSKVQTMPLEIWTDINGNAARTQFKGGTKYIRADAQATVEALQAQLPATMQECTILFKECEKGHGRLTATNWVDSGCQTCVVDALQQELVASKAENSRLMGVAEQQRELRESGDVYIDEVKAQLAQVQRELEQEKKNAFGLAATQCDDPIAGEYGHMLCGAVMEKQRQLDAERGKVKAEQEQWEIQAREGGRLKDQLTQLQALVRALPVPEEGGFPIVEVDGDYYVNHTSRFSTKAEADAYTGLLIYRATLDATTPATKGSDGE